MGMPTKCECGAIFEWMDGYGRCRTCEISRLSAENSEFRMLLRMVLANLRNPILGGISDGQILAIDEALDYPYDSD